MITARAIVGTAMNWNKRVNTVATKLKNSFKGWISSQPKMPPRMSAPNHYTNLSPLEDIAFLSGISL